MLTEDLPAVSSIWLSKDYSYEVEVVGHRELTREDGTLFREVECKSINPAGQTWSLGFEDGTFLKRFTPKV